jgi:hypothetical protein
MARPNVTEEENCMAQSRCSVMFFSQNGLVLDHPVPVGTTVNDPYYCSLLQDKVRPALHRKQPELLERGAILLQDNATPHRHHDVQNLVQRWG